MEKTRNGRNHKILTFRPVSERFADFDGLMNLLGLEVWRGGITKIIPPPDFVATDKDVSQLMINSVTHQEPYLRKGLFGKPNKSNEKVLLITPISECKTFNRNQSEFEKESEELNR